MTLTELSERALAALDESTTGPENLLRASEALQRALDVLEQLHEAAQEGDPPNGAGWQLAMNEVTKQAGLVVVLTTLFCAQADVDLESEIEQLLQSLEEGS